MEFPRKRHRNRTRRREKWEERRKKTFPPRWYSAIRLDLLLERLESEGFGPFGITEQLRVRQLLGKLNAVWVPTKEDLKFRLAPLLCKDEEEQNRFYALFNEHFKRYRVEFKGKPGAEQKSANSPAAKPFRPFKRKRHFEDKTRSYQLPHIAAIEKNIPMVGAHVPQESYTPPKIETARKEPIAIELNIPGERTRAWNLLRLESELRPMREMEITAIQEWDVPGSIKKTIQSGGLPLFVRKSRLKSPQYLFLIEQKSSKDHLAALYADLVLELQSHDLDADFYYYYQTPVKCWKERRKPSTYISLERLHQNHGHGKIIVVGEAASLTEAMQHKKIGEAILPDELAYRLKQEWDAAALLNTKSTTEWNDLEEVLCHLFPVAPANIQGLGSLIGQWKAQSAFTPYYWRIQMPEPATPSLILDYSDQESVETLISRLKLYLGKLGFELLCAVSIYPEIYWQLTQSFKDIILPENEGWDAQQREEIWTTCLLKLSRLQWFRIGRIPAEIRGELRKKLPPQKQKAVNDHLSDMLKRSEPPEGSYAKVDRDYTIALLEFESLFLDSPQELRDKMTQKFIQNIESQGINLSDISDAVGRNILKNFSQPQNTKAAAKSAKRSTLSLEQHKGEYLQQAALSLQAGIAAEQQNKLEDARKNFKLSLSLYQDLEDLAGMLNALNELARLEKKASDPFTASGYLEKALNINKEIGSLSQLARAYLELAKTYRELGTQVNIGDMLESAIHLFKQTEDRTGQIEAESELADFMAEQKNFDYAIDLLTRILEYHRSIQDLEIIKNTEERLEKLKERKQRYEDDPEHENQIASNFIQVYKYLNHENKLSWERIQDAFYRNKNIVGFIQRLVKGGFCVMVDNLETFLPASLVDIRIRTQLEQFLGMEYEFKVVKINETLKNAVLSRKAILESYITELREKTLQNIDTGQVYEGTITNIVDFGVFVQFNGVDGLVYKDELSWERNKTPRELYRLNQNIRVQIKEFDEDKKRIGLSIKALIPNPWTVLPEWVKEDITVKGKVIKQVKDGTIIEVLPAITGLLHLSETCWKKRFSPGQEIEVSIKNIDYENQKIFLSRLNFEEEEYNDLTLLIGQKMSAIIENIAKFGLFITTADGLSGLVHISDISWQKFIKHPQNIFNIGENIEVVLIQIRREDKKLGFGIKQLTPDPWPDILQKYKVDSEHQATVISSPDINGFLFIRFEDGLEIRTAKKHVAPSNKSTPELGDVVMVVITELDQSTHKITVSHKKYLKKYNLPNSPQQPTLPPTSEEQAVSLPKNSIGDVIDLESIKASLPEDISAASPLGDQTPVRDVHFVIPEDQKKQLIQQINAFIDNLDEDIQDKKAYMDVLEALFELLFIKPNKSVTVMINATINHLKYFISNWETAIQEPRRKQELRHSIADLKRMLR